MKYKFFFITVLLLLSSNLFAAEQAGGSGNGFYNALINVIIFAAFGVFIYLIAVFSSALNSVSKMMMKRIEENKNKTTILVIGLLLTTTSSYAAEPIQFLSTPFPADNFTILVIAITMIILMTISIIMANTVLRMMRSLLNVPEPVKAKPTASWIDRWIDRYNSSVPLEREQDVLLNHDYDGIRELDNSLPPRWLYGFYFTIIFSLVYMVNFHAGGNEKSSSEEYAEEVKIAAQQQLSKIDPNAATIDENTVQYKTDEASLVAGKKIYAANCETCHGTKGEGLAGPNLTDAYWIHGGGGIKNIFKTIYNGVPGKAMVKWAGILRPSEIENVASYVWSQQSNPVKGREPEGEIYKPEASVPDTTKAN
jgi:cytochrome c oxidase cbb3-type subunit 3